MLNHKERSRKSKLSTYITLFQLLEQRQRRTGVGGGDESIVPTAQRFERLKKYRGFVQPDSMQMYPTSEFVVRLFDLLCHQGGSNLYGIFESY